MSDLSQLFGRQPGIFAADPRFAGRDEGPGTTAAQGADAAMAAARAEAFEQGLAYARAEAQAEAEAAAAVTRRFAFGFARLDAELSADLAARITETVVALCEATLGPLAVERKALAARVERAVAMFSRVDDERVIRMNLDDITRVAPLLPPEWKFVADPTLPAGTLRVETQSGGVEDGPAEWVRAIRQTLGLATGG